MEAGNGTTAYHLDVLEENGFVTSTRSGFGKFYIKSGVKFPYRMQSRLSFTELNILSVMEGGKAVSVSGIAEMIDKSVQTASHYSRKLERKKFIECRKDRQVKLCTITEKGEKSLKKSRL